MEHTEEKLPELKYYFSNLTYSAVICRKDNANLTEIQAKEIICRCNSYNALLDACREGEKRVCFFLEKLEAALPITIVDRIEHDKTRSCLDFISEAISEAEKPIG